tara:strand:- start:2419 stop:3129 length:711 start_codon:yes stop_codon:yes gene_type:complete
MKIFHILIQARLDSRRLPRKVLKKMDETTILKCLIDRLKALKVKNKVVILVPNDKKNVYLYNYVKSLGVTVFKGSNKNVLDRYYKAAKYFSADSIIRITSDCPFIDLSILTNMMKNFKRKDCDYYSNIHPRTFPKGLDVEIFKFKALEKAWINAKSNYEKEHVTPFIVNHKKFKHQNYKNKINLNNKIRITLDTKKDLFVIKEIYKKLKSKINFGLKEILILKKKQPNLFKYNMEN